MPEPEAKAPPAPTADDLKALQSTYDKKLSDKDKEIAELRKVATKADPAVVDDLALNEKREAFTKEMDEFKQTKVAWHRERVLAEYGLVEADAKELAKLEDPRDMELYALKKTRPAPADRKQGAGHDREPSQTPAAASGAERMRAGLEQRFSKFYPGS